MANVKQNTTQIDNHEFPGRLSLPPEMLGAQSAANLPPFRLGVGCTAFLPAEEGRSMALVLTSAN